MHIRSFKMSNMGDKRRQDGAKMEAMKTMLSDVASWRTYET